MTQEELSCIDCGTVGCAKGTGPYPRFCPTAAGGEGFQEASAKAYEDDLFALEAMRAASAVSAEAFTGRWCRVEETLAFAREMGWRRIGIACCAGLMEEARIFAKILRAQGYSPYGICCKNGAVPKGRLGAQVSCCDYGEVSCNPLMQARLLAEAATEVNVVVGLCVGHDMLFSRASQAPVITLVTKDRALAHNTAGALRSVGTASFYSSMLEPAPAFHCAWEEGE